MLQRLAPIELGNFSAFWFNLYHEAESYVKGALQRKMRVVSRYDLDYCWIYQILKNDRICSDLEDNVDAKFNRLENKYEKALQKAHFKLETDIQRGHVQHLFFLVLSLTKKFSFKAALRVV